MTAAERNRPVTGVMMLLAAVTMLFAAFTSAMVVRRGLSGDWVSTPLPHILWLNTVLLAASSFVLREAPTSRTAAVRKRFAVALGILFLAGQLEAWRELNAAGVYLPSNPAASFFYILTTVHAVHVIGGLFALQFANRQAAAIYWHFMTGLWIYVLLLFSTWG